MKLADWVMQQLAINDGAVHVRRDGVESPLGAEELAEELGRRLEGIVFRPRFTVDIRSPVESLSSLSAVAVAGMENLRQISFGGIEAPAEIWRDDPPGRPPTVQSRLANEILARINSGQSTAEGLWELTHGQIRQLFGGCHPKTFKRTLTLTVGPRRPK